MVNASRSWGRFGLHAAIGAMALAVALLGHSYRPAVVLATLQDQPAPGQSLRLGGRVGSVAVVDLNADRSPDIIAAHLDDGTVSVYLGDGSGGFRAAAGSPFPAGPSPEDIAAADFNSDGRLDIAVANHETDYLTVLLDDGTGRLTPAPQSTIRAGSRPHQHGIATADFNADGRADLAVDGRDDDAVLVLEGDGRGGFPASERRVAVGRAPYWRLRAADVNSDGRADIITTNSEGSSVTLLISGGTGFTARQIATERRPFAVAVGHVNGDRRPDLAVVHYQVDGARDRVTILLGDGTGAFAPAAGSPFPTGRSSVAVAIGDVNGDGIGDVAVANIGSNNVTLLHGGASIRETANSPLRVGDEPTSVALADVNGDGRAELITANVGSGDVTVLSSR